MWPKPGIVLPNSFEALDILHAPISMCTDVGGATVRAVKVVSKGPAFEHIALYWRALSPAVKARGFPGPQDPMRKARLFEFHDALAGTCMLPQEAKSRN